MTYARRTDTGSQGLVAAARQLGFHVEVCQGKIDAFLYHRRTGWIAVDWKRSAKAPKTDRQKELDRLNVPIAYVWSVEQLQEMVRT